MSRLEWIDWLTKYGLFAVGLGLLAGLFTRLWCVVGAGFLLMFYLAMPPWPGLPENPKAEGHYYFINKNIIEMFALMALATTHSGRWLGLDGLFQFLIPRAGGLQIRNPKLENRNKFEFQKPNDRTLSCCFGFAFSVLGFVSDFEIRISDLVKLKLQGVSDGT